jgi:hypothetical protein
MAICRPEGEDEGLFGIVEGDEVAALVLIVGSISLLFLKRRLVDIFAVYIDSIDVLLIVRYDAILDTVTAVDTALNLIVI